MWPLLDFIDDEEESGKTATEIIMDEIGGDIDWEVKRAIGEVITKKLGDRSSDV